VGQKLQFGQDATPCYGFVAVIHRILASFALAQWTSSRSASASFSSASRAWSDGGLSEFHSRGSKSMKYRYPFTRTSRNPASDTRPTTSSVVNGCRYRPPARSSPLCASVGWDRFMTERISVPDG